MVGLRNYTKNISPICALCGQKVWNIIVCKNCGGSFCRRHCESALSHEWVCPICTQRQQQFMQPSQATANSKCMQLIKTANQAMENSDSTTAEALIEELFKELF